MESDSVERHRFENDVAKQNQRRLTFILMKKSRGFSFVRENKHKKTSLPQDSGLEEVSMLIDAIFSPASQHFHKTNTMNVAQIIYAFVKKILRPY